MRQEIKKINPVKKLFGKITLPGDKSISHRAVMIGAISRGKTNVKNILDCDDCNYTIRAFRDMGIKMEKDNGYTAIYGKGLKGLKKPKWPIDIGNSGTSMRLLSGILTGQNFDVILRGDASLSKRPMKRIVEPLSLMGADIKANPDGYPPIKIKGGKVKPIDYKMPIPSAQIKSAILLAGLYADGITIVEEAFKSRDHTERMLKYFGSKLKINGLKVSLEGARELTARTLEIPGDISSASFFIAGVILLKGSKIRIDSVNINPTRAGILKILSKMGVKIKIYNKKNSFEPFGDLEIESSSARGTVIDEKDIPSVIDELPILFVIAACSEGRTVIKGARELRVKETDRIRSMRENLEKMGAKIHLEDNDIIIDGVEKLRGASLKSFGDHRTCMAMTIAALAAEGSSTIDDVGCVSKSFPQFFRTLEKLMV